MRKKENSGVNFHLKQLCERGLETEETLYTVEDIKERY